MLTEKELGERLKNVREVRRISQFRLGEMVECGQGHIGKLEKGEHYPKLPTLYKISEALNISVSDILSESPPSRMGCFRRRKSAQTSANGESCVGLA